MKQLITAVAFMAAASLAQATPLYHPQGQNLTYGAVSNGQTIMSDTTNPAAGAAVLKENDSQYRLGIPGSIGIGLEFGKVDKLYERIDAEAKKFQNTQLLTPTGDVAVAVGELNTAIASLNAVLADVQANGYAKAFGSVDVPLVVAHQGLGGSLVFDANVSFAASVAGLHENIDFNAAEVLDGGPLYDDPNDDVNLTLDGFNVPTGFTIDNDSGVLVSASMVTDLSLGYSRPMMKSEQATLYAGTRAHYYKVEHSRVGIRMTDLDTDVEQQFDDALDQDRGSDTGFGVDLGVLWVSEHYRLGATLANINEPSFDTGTIDLTASGYTDPNSPVAQQLAANDSYVMERQLALEAAVYTASQNWVISAGFDANAIEDALGDEYQWASLSAAYATDTWFIPGVRLGVRQNMAGTEIKYLTGGLSFGPVSLDVAYSPESVTIDGSSVPRGVMANLGLELTF